MGLRPATRREAPPARYSPPPVPKRDSNDDTTYVWGVIMGVSWGGGTEPARGRIAACHHTSSPIMTVNYEIVDP